MRNVGRMIRAAASRCQARLPRRIVVVDRTPPVGEATRAGGSLGFPRTLEPEPQDDAARAGEDCVVTSPSTGEAVPGVGQVTIRRDDTRCPC